MRRVLTSLLLAGAVALATPCAMLAQHGGGHAGGGFGGGHAGGFSGGHVGGFSGGGFSSRGFGGGFAGPSAGSASHYFPAPRMNFSGGPMSSGSISSPTRFAPATHPYGWPTARSPFGQLSIPAVRRGPYPGAYSGAYSRTNSGSTNNRSSSGQPNHSGNHDGDHDGHYHYRSSYHSGVTFYSPYYATGLGWYWPWWPYLGNWDNFDDSYGWDNGAASGQNSIQSPDQSDYEQSYNSMPEQDYARPAYQPGIAAGSAPAIPEPAVTIIYKDGHSQQIHNYALTRTTLMMLDDASSGLTPQISLDEINLPATEQVNRAAGIDFRPPIKN